MRGHAARQEHDAADLLQPELEDIGRQELGGDGDAAFEAGLDVAMAGEIGEQTAAHVHHVVALFAHVRVVHAVEELDVVEDHAVHGLGGWRPGGDLLLHGAQPALIAQHQELRREDHGGDVGQPLPGQLLEVLELLFGGGHGPAEIGQLQRGAAHQRADLGQRRLADEHDLAHGAALGADLAAHEAQLGQDGRRRAGDRCGLQGQQQAGHLDGRGELHGDGAKDLDVLGARSGPGCLLCRVMAPTGRRPRRMGTATNER